MIKRLSSLLLNRNYSDFPRKLVEEIVDNKLAEKLDPIGIALRIINANIDSKFTELDDKISSMESTNESNFQNLDKKIDSNFKTSEKNRKKDFTNTHLVLNDLRQALGRGLDALCRAGLERHFDLSKIAHSEVLRGHKIKDQEGEVHGGKMSEIELDVFCEEPLTILECTSILKKENGAEKLQKFFDKKKFVEKRFGRPSKAFFAVIAIQDGFLDTAVTFCKDNSIDLIDAKYEFPDQKWEAKK